MRITYARDMNRLALALVVISCGHGSISSGVEQRLTIASLDADQKARLCRYLVSLQEQPPRDVDCGQFSAVVGIDDVNEAIDFCIAQGTAAGCEYTVGQAEVCAESRAALSDAEICGIAGGEMPPPAACAEVTEGCWTGI